MSSVAIITARGGSKRIPRKNIKPFLGKPIILYSIEAALASGLFDEVMVSTDDQEIADISVAAGACVPFMRSAETSNDFAGTRAVLLEVLEEYSKRGRKFDYMACLYPTNPFITAGKLMDAMNLLKEKNCREVLPVVEFSYPPQRSFIRSASGSIQYKWPEYYPCRSQDLEKFYHDAGQFYCYDVEKFLSETGDIYPLICPETQVQDIDNENDWVLAEIKMEYLMSRGLINEKQNSHR